MNGNRTQIQEEPEKAFFCQTAVSDYNQGDEIGLHWIYKNKEMLETKTKVSQQWELLVVLPVWQLAFWWHSISMTTNAKFPEKPPKHNAVS